MKPSAAFALGLWTGAVVVAALWLHFFSSGDRLHAQLTPEATTQLSDQTDRIQELEQENARLVAEAERLKQTVAELTGNLAAGADTYPAVRRIPFQRPPGTVEAGSLTDEVVTNGDRDALAQLEQAALQNDEGALEALARAADRDSGAALTRVWNSGQLSFVNKVKAAHYLGATLEVNPQADGLLHALFEDSSTDMRLLFAAVDGIAKPGLSASPGAPVPLPTPLPFEPDFAVRVKLLDAVRAATTDEQLRAHVELARDELMSRWAEVEPPAQ
jgi:hypothetical protein